MKTLIAFFALFGAVASAADISAVKVKVLDGFGGDAGSVVSRCQTKKGAAYDPVTITRDVNSLKESNEFEDITADAQRTADGVEVTFYVKRKMRYQAPLVVKGNAAFNEAKIARESELRDGYLYGEGDFAAAAAKVRAAYRKKFYTSAKVTPVTKVLSGNSVTVTFVIDEGPLCEIEDYVFEGASGVEASDLREAIGDFPWWNPKGWFADAPVTPEQKAQCVEKILAAYRERGYLDAAVTGPEQVPSGKEGRVNEVFKIVEGPCYVIGKTSIAGLTRYAEADVAAKSALPEAGTVAGQKTLEEAAHRIEVAVGSGDLGLSDTRVDIKRMPAADGANRLDVVFQVKEGVPVVISEVKIRGNDYTKDKVIRREIPLGPGDRMLADRAERGQHRLENLDYFSRVRYSLEATDRGKDASGAEYRNLVYEVEEKNTGSFMVGLGASSVDSVYVSAEVSQSNFDLFAPGKLFRGGGQKGRLYAAAGPRIQTYEASVTEPHLFDRLLELTVEGYRRQRWYDEYDIIRSGAAASLAYPVKFWPGADPFGRLGFRLSGEFIEFDDVESDIYTYKGKTGQLLREEERKYGDAFEPVVRLFWSHNNCDNYRIPTRGSRSQIFADIAPGGDNKYWRVGFNHRHYFPIWERYRHVLMVGLRGETIDGLSDDVPIYNRMFLGGPKSIRGIEYRHVSPHAQKATWHDYIPWGGQTLFCANFEYTVPIVKMLRLAVFSDLGAIGEDEFDFDFSDTFAWTVGLGVRLDIPMFPIRLDFATPIEKPDHAEEEVFSFSVGYDF